LAVAAESELALLTRRFRPALMSYFLRRVRSHAEAEDLTQDVFVRLARLDPTEWQSAEAYVFRIAANLLSDRARKARTRRRHADEELTVAGREVDPLDPDRVAAGRRSLAVLAEKLKELPERTRTIFVLYRVETMNKRAIAEALGVSVSTVEKQCAVAMAHLMLNREDRA
jgi:RNA polymerase sigma factor (sigma-70 family)